MQLNELDFTNQTQMIDILEQLKQHIHKIIIENNILKERNYELEMQATWTGEDITSITDRDN